MYIYIYIGSRSRGASFSDINKIAESIDNTTVDFCSGRCVNLSVWALMHKEMFMFMFMRSCIFKHNYK
jgi:hypothetical protein